MFPWGNYYGIICNFQYLKIICRIRYQYQFMAIDIFFIIFTFLSVTAFHTIYFYGSKYFGFMYMLVSFS